MSSKNSCRFRLRNKNSLIINTAKCFVNHNFWWEFPEHFKTLILIIYLLVNIFQYYPKEFLL